MSKRTIVMSSVLAALLMATAMTGSVLARGPQDPEGTSTMAPRGFVDADGDGVNDRYAQGDGVRDLDGDGVVDGSNLGNGYAYGFVDEDGDGINDRTADGDGVQDLDGTGNGYAYGFVDEDGDGVNDRGDGVPDYDGSNFVDADGDGLCDTCADGECTPGTGEAAVRRSGSGGRWSR